MSAAGSAAGAPATAVGAQSHDALLRAWARLGAGFLIAPSRNPAVLEELVADTARVAREDARLFFTVASWLATHHALVDGRALGRACASLETEASAIAGALLTVAIDEAPTAAALRAAQGHCRPLRPSDRRALFTAYERRPALLADMQRRALPVFLRWGFWQDEITRKADAIRPIPWLLRHVPEMRLRALVGPGLDTAILEHVTNAGTHGSAYGSEPVTVASVARSTGCAYASVHEAATRLVGRGLLAREPAGRRQRLTITSDAHAWLA